MEPVEIVVLSGKGGTGKTSLTGAFAHLAGNQVICDLDVDAPDLHLLLHPQVEKTEDFQAGHEAVIDGEKCIDCGRCLEVCRFGAVVRGEDTPRIDPLKCEGCRVCVQLCPEKAIAFPERHSGQWFVSRTRFGPFVHAQLFPGQENSGLLVSLLRREARELAGREGHDLILCDGAPGIGCPVISSLSGVTLAVAVTEPTPSGSHDLKRVVELAGHFRVPLAVIINKADLNSKQVRVIEELCLLREIEIVARLPHDPVITRAMVAGQVVTEFKPNGFSDLVRQAWSKIEALARNRSAQLAKQRRRS